MAIYLLCVSIGQDPEENCDLSSVVDLILPQGVSNRKRKKEGLLIWGRTVASIQKKNILVSFYLF
jgi:hypothetical protein